MTQCSAPMPTFSNYLLIGEYYSLPAHHVFILPRIVTDTHNATTASLDLPSSIIFSAHIGKIVAESKYAANVTGYTDLIKKKDATGLRVLLTHTTQEASVLAQPNTAATAFANAWVASGALVSSTFTSDLQNAAAKTFRELIDITTEIEIQYVSGAFFGFRSCVMSYV